MNFVSLILALAIISGQLIKVPLTSGGISLLDLVIIFFCLIGLFRNKFNLKKPPLFIIFAFIFILVCILSLIFTPLHLLSAEYLISFFYVLRFSAYILLGYLTYSGIFHINNTLVYSGIGLAIMGLFQLIFLPDLSFISQYGWDPHYFRTVSTFLDPNFAGAFFVLTLLLLKKKPKIFFVIVYLALLTTFSRSSYLMFLISGLIMKRYFKTIVLFIILLLGFQIYIQLVSKPRHIDREQSASFRLGTWQQGWQLFSSHPVLGVGFNAYTFGLREYGLADAQFLQGHGSSSNDSSILFVAATTGVIGLISYLFFLFSFIWKTKNNLLISSVLGLLIHSIFANSLFFPPILFWILLISVSPKK